MSAMYAAASVPMAATQAAAWSLICLTAQNFKARAARLSGGTVTEPKLIQPSPDVTLGGASSQCRDFSFLSQAMGYMVAKRKDAPAIPEKAGV